MIRPWTELPTWGKLFVAWQLLMPVAMWATGSQRFAWMMYGRFEPIPTIMVQRDPAGAFEPLDLRRSLGHIRSDLDYVEAFPRQLCRTGDFLTVRVQPVEGTPTDHRC